MPPPGLPARPLHSVHTALAKMMAPLRRSCSTRMWSRAGKIDVVGVVAARRRAHVLGVERVLEREHDAVHWHLVERGVAAVLRIEFGGAFERIGIVAKHLADRQCAGGSGPKATDAVSRI